MTSSSVDSRDARLGSQKVILPPYSLTALTFTFEDVDGITMYAGQSLSEAALAKACA